MKLSYLPWESPAARSANACVGDVDQMMSYAQIETLSAACAEQLDELGVGEGDVIAIMLRNSIAFVVGVLAAWRLGAAVTPVNPNFTETELGYQLEDSRAKLLITTPETMGEGTNPDVQVFDASSIRQELQGSSVFDKTLPGHAALIIYTSGSTGRPKGVLIDHSNLRAMTSQWASHVEMTNEDQALLVLPLFHANALLMSWLSPMSVGGSVILLEKFERESFIDAIERFRPSYFSAVPTILARLVELPENQKPDMSSIRFVLCGAAPVTKELLSLCAERFDLRIIEGYGLTEGTCASACIPLHGPHKIGTVGPAIIGQKIIITDEQGTPVPTGQRGEIRISGPTIMRGYLGKSEATADTIVDGWLRTGDIGILDEDGYLSIVDRIKDMIIRGGENLYPKEIEAFLATHPAVLEVAVVGAPHGYLGEVPVAYVVVHPGSGAAPEELLAHCAYGLMKIKVPSNLHILEALPRNPVGKIDKIELRRRTPSASEAHIRETVPV